MFQQKSTQDTTNWSSMKFLKRSFVICLFVFCAHAELFITSCTNWTFLNNIDFNGGDLPNQPVGIANSPQDCANYCCANSACFAFSMNANGACYLKASDGYSEGNIPGVQSGCFSGQCSAGPPIPPDTYFPWFNLSIPRYERLAILVANFTIPEVISWLNDDAPAINRLGLPGFSWEAEALHGVSWNGAATVFPENIAWGATWDVSLISEVAKIIALEARAKYVSGRGADGSSVEFAGLSFMTPNNNLFIDRSTFYTIGSPQILQLFDGISRIISKKDPWRMQNDNGVDGLRSITKLSYTIDDKSNNQNDNIFVVNNQ